MNYTIYLFKIGEDPNIICIFRSWSQRLDQTSCKVGGLNFSSISRVFSNQTTALVVCDDVCQQRQPPSSGPVVCPSHCSHRRFVPGFPSGRSVRYSGASFSFIQAASCAICAVPVLLTTLTSPYHLHFRFRNNFCEGFQRWVDLL